MATNRNHVILSSVEDNNDINEIYPYTNAEDININRRNINIPVNTNAQEVINNISPIAYKNNIEFIYNDNNESLSEINDNITSEKTTWSSSKIVDYYTNNTPGFTSVEETTKDLINNSSMSSYHIFCIDTSLMPDITTPEKLQGCFIVEYFPFLENSGGNIGGTDISNDKRCDYNYQAPLVIQRWTYLDKEDEGYVYIRMKVKENGLWGGFIKINYEKYNL